MKKVSSSAFISFTRWLLALAAISSPALGQPVSGLVPWGDNFFGQLNVPPGLTNVAAIASGFGHNVTLSADGTVIAWGDNAGGQTNVPPSLSGVRAITAGSSHSLALKSNGTLVAWGTASYALNSVPAGLSNIVGIGSGPAASHNLVIRSDGTVTGWGDNSSGQLNIPFGLSNVVAVGGGIFHSLALMADGSLTAWGNNSFQQIAIPPGSSNIIAIGVGVYHNVALRANGTVVVWGDNSHGQLNVPPGLSNVIAIACGYYHSVAVKADGTLVGWGSNSSGQSQPPVGLTNVVAVAAGNAHSLALAGSAPLIFAQPHDLTVVESSPANFSVGAVGFPAVSYQWRFNGTNLAGATGSSLTLAPVHLSDAGTYSVLVANAFGSVTSSPALLTVNPSLIARCADVTVSADANCVANASIDAGSTNPSGGTITLTQSPPGPYPLGTNLVTLNVSDDHGGSASCTATVIVLDRTPPQLTPPTPISAANDPDQCGATVSFALPVAVDACSAVTQIICTPPSGSFFPMGTTVVQCTATDAVGNTATNTFTVTVYDNQPPTLVCPADIVVTNAPDASTSIVTYSPVASDNCPGLGPVVCDPPSGSAFGPGVHPVNCSVTDAASNSTACSFRVTVYSGNQAPVPIIEISRLLTLPGCAKLTVLAADGANADVICDGSKSYDPEHATFQAAWFVGSSLLSTDLIAGVTLPLGTQTITLVLDDGFPNGRSSTSVQVQVLSPKQVIERIEGLVENSGLPVNKQKPLLASLSAAAASAAAGRVHSELGQLGAFENKVHAQLGRSNPALANELLDAADQLSEALSPEAGGKAKTKTAVVHTPSNHQ